MKNDSHLAYRSIFNFPLQISSRDSVKAHLEGKLLLIAMLPREWPKLRARDILNRRTVINTFEVAGKKVEAVQVEEYKGVLIDGKYFFTQDVLGQSMSLDLLITPFSELGTEPMVRREWNADYMSSNPFWFAHVEKGTKDYFGVETYHHIRDYEKAGITNMLDLLAYSYKFEWHPDTSDFQLITDEHVIAKRIRKPWMQHLVQLKYGESPATEADLGKVVSYLVRKVKLTVEEASALSGFINRPVGIVELERINKRQEILNTLLEAYNSNTPLKTGADLDKDPMFNLAYE